MFIAQQKWKENIAEYILYMWQIEDIIRAYNLSVDAIHSDIIAKSNRSSNEKRQEFEWYESLVEMMRTENVRQKGHIQLVKNTLNDLIDLHYALLRSPKHADYGALFYHTLPVISALKTHTSDNETEDIEACFIFLYGVWMLRLKKEDISPETLDSQQQISKLLALLSAKYRLYITNELELDD